MDRTSHTIRPSHIMRMIVLDPPTSTVVLGLDVLTRDPVSMIVRTSGLHAWLTGTCIQHALPELSDDDREWLISGLTPASWDQVMADLEDDSTNQDDDIWF